MFVYCGNNPVMREDLSGRFWVLANPAKYMFDVIDDIVQLCSSGENEITPAYTKNRASVQISNSYEIDTAIVMYGYCFYLNHFSDYKDYFVGTTGGMVFEWITHNVGYAWYGIAELFDTAPEGGISESAKSKDRCAHVDLGPTIFHDSASKPSTRSTIMKIAYCFLSPFGSQYDYMMYTLT